MPRNYGSIEENRPLLEESGEKSQPADLQWPKLVACILLSAMLFMAMAVSILAPFYPEEANERGVSVSEYGFVFGVFDLVTCIFSLPVGNMVSKSGPRAFFLFGVFMEAGSALFFATLTLISNGPLFLAVSFLCRILGGIGKVFINVGTLTLFPLLYPDKAATLISWGESVYGAGFIIAPAAGGFLYQLAGLSLPFLVTGGLLGFLFVISFCFIPTRHTENTEEVGNQNLLLSLLKIPKVWVCLLSGAIVPAYVAFLSATFEPSIRFLNLSTSTVGLIFAVSAVTYMISSVICGWQCDRNVNPLHLMIYGSFVTGLGVSVIALSTIFDEYTLYIDIAGLAAMGLGAGGLFVPTLVYMKRMSIASGFPEDVASLGVISGFFVASISFGGVVGPTVGGILYDNIGFTYSNIVFVVLYILAGFLTTFLRIAESGCSSILYSVGD